MTYRPYIAVFLDKQSRKDLLRWFPPIHETVIANHVTLVYDPTEEEVETIGEGDKVFVRVIGEANDDQVQALVVELPAELEQHLANEIPHVTVSKTSGTPSEYANRLVAKGFTKTPSIVLFGTTGLQIK